MEKLSLSEFTDGLHDVIIDNKVVVLEGYGQDIVNVSFVNCEFPAQNICGLVNCDFQQCNFDNHVNFDDCRDLSFDECQIDKVDMGRRYIEIITGDGFIGDLETEW